MVGVLLRGIGPPPRRMPGGRSTLPVMRDGIHAGLPEGHVQVKSAATQNVLNDYVEQFKNQRDRYARMIFAVHSPNGTLTAPVDEPVHLWTCDRVAEFVVHTGLGEWVESRLA